MRAEAMGAGWSATQRGDDQRRNTLPSAPQYPGLSCRKCSPPVSPPISLSLITPVATGEVRPAPAPVSEEPCSSERSLPAEAVPDPFCSLRLLVALEETPVPAAGPPVAREADGLWARPGEAVRTSPRVRHMPRRRCRLVRGCARPTIVDTSCMSSSPPCAPAAAMSIGAAETCMHRARPARECG